MQINNSRDRYGFVAATFHWIITLLVIGMLCVGLYMSGLPKSPFKFQIYGLHKATGVLILFIVLLRLSWRLTQIRPELAQFIPAWQRRAAHFTHFLLYAVLLSMPLTGWLMSSAVGSSVSFYGWFVVPELIAPNKALVSVFATLHEYLAYTLIALITIHVAAVVQHYVVYNENILRKMWPWSS